MGSSSQSATPESLRHRLARVVPALLLWNVATGVLRWRLGLRGGWQGRRWHLRDRSDLDIFRQVVVLDEYGMTGRRLQSRDVVIDVGGHAGAFGFLCHLLGSRHVVSYEAQKDNFDRLERNYRRLAGARAVYAAVFRSDPAGPETLIHSGPPEDGNTGAGNVVFGGRGRIWEKHAFDSRRAAGSEEVSTHSLDDILSAHDRVHLLKLDCEGSEFPILLTSQLLSRVDRIIGEYHEIPAEDFSQLSPGARLDGIKNYRFDHLKDRLTAQGFVVEAEATHPQMGFFRATR